MAFIERGEEGATIMGWLVGAAGAFILFLGRVLYSERKETAKRLEQGALSFAIMREQMDQLRISNAKVEQALEDFREELRGYRRRLEEEVGLRDREPNSYAGPLPTRRRPNVSHSQPVPMDPPKEDEE